MDSMRKILFCLGLCILGNQVLLSDDIDDLFALPDTPREEPLEQENPLDLVSELTTQAVKVGASVSLNGGAALGLERWPEEGEDLNWSDHFDAELGYELSAQVFVDARPKDYLRFYLDVGTSLEKENLEFPSPEISELFVDYTLNDTVFFRVGKQSITWGLGQVLGNPGNILSGVKNGLAVKAFFPLGTNGLTTVIWGEKGFFSKETIGSPSLFAYAFLLEQTFGPITAGLSSRYQDALDLASALYLKTMIAGIDIGLEGRLDWGIKDSIESGNLKPGFRILTNLFWQSPGTPKLNILGEYLFDSRYPDKLGHRLGLVLGLTGLPWGGWRPGISWNHAFHDQSGQIVLGLEGPLAPSLRASIGVPFVYGEPESYYRSHSFDGSDRVLSAIFSAKLTFSF